MLFGLPLQEVRPSKGEAGGEQPTGVPETPVQTAPSIRVKNADTNLRSAPGTDYAVVGNVQPGQVFPLVQTEGDWYMIRLPDNSTA